MSKPVAGSLWVGRSIRRVEDGTLLIGDGRFTSDLRTDLHVKFVRSPRAAGRILRISIPSGVRGFALSDLGDVNPITPVLYRPDYQSIGQSLLADGEVKFVGEPIVALVAESAAEAEDHCDLVEVDIEPLAAVVHMRDAVAEGARLVHGDTRGNVIVEGNIATPGVEDAFAASHEVVELDVRSGRQAALPLEPRAAHAAFDKSTGRVTLTCSTQNPHIVRTGVADALGIPESLLRVVAPDVGGGFGQKMSLPVEYCVVVALARKYRCSAAWIEDRRENLIASFHGRDQRVHLRGAFDANARLMAIEADIMTNIGAYSCYPTTCGVEPLMALAELPGPYDVRNYACRTRGITTNTCPMSPYRGVSRPILTFCIERLMDIAAARFGLDPVEIRRRNLIDTFPYKSATGLVYDEGSYKEALEKAAGVIDVPAFRQEQERLRKDGRYIGIGFSSFSERTGYGTPAFAARNMDITPGFDTVEISMDPSGFVEARTGASPHGQGLRTTMSQIIADQLGIAPDKIRIIHGDTDATPYGFGTFASRSIVIAGGAAMLAAGKLREKLIGIAGQLFEADPTDIELRAGKAVVIGTDREIAIATLARTAYHSVEKMGGISPGLRDSATYDPPGTFSNACHVALLEVDHQTGRVQLDRYLVIEDAGRLVNPRIADGQIHGGVAQGIANALFEEIIYDEAGNILTATLADYMVPTMAEIPEIEIHHLETLSDASITRAKGLGEGGAIGPPAAVVNAINDALSPFGFDINEFPVTPKLIRSLVKSSLEE